MNGKDITIEELYSHPIVQELLDEVTKPKDIENIKIPYVIKNKILMSPGVWNNMHYSINSIHNAFLKTNWADKEIRSLFLDHADKSSREWIGEIKNPRKEGDNVLGDLVIIDKPTAQKLAYGAKMGISPKVHGEEENNEMMAFLFDNFSVVINPAVKTAYINNMEVGKMPKKKLEEETEEETKEEIKEETKEETIKEETKEAAPETKEEVKTENKEETKETFDDELMEALSAIETENKGGVVVIARKAKELREKGESWKDAVLRATKTLSEEAAMAETDAIDQIIKLAQMLQQKKKIPYPRDGTGPHGAGAGTGEGKADGTGLKNKEMETVEAEQVKTLKENVQELSEKLAMVEAKLKEPDKQSVKTEELSVIDAEKLAQSDPDAAFLNALQRS